MAPTARRVAGRAAALLALAAALGAGAAGPDACDGCVADDASLLQFAGVRPVAVDEGELAALTFALEGEEMGFGEGLSDPRTPPCCGSDLDFSLLVEDHNLKCETVFLTNVFGTRKDPQGKIHGPPTAAYFDRYYRSILSLPGGRAKAVILHDFLTEDVTKNYSTADGAISFLKVDISGMDAKMGLNDLRYQLFEEQIKNHPEWDTVFMTDISDVVAVHNPCGFVDKQPDKLFAGKQKIQMKPYTYIRGKFAELGGKYLQWYDSQTDYGLELLNAGILGGKRSVVMKALSHLNTVLLDPELASRKNGTSVTVNMPAFNYALYSNFDGNLVSGFPLHSKFWAYENRTDVYFRHK